MNYIRNMTNTLLEEIDFTEKLIEYGEDIAYGYWFQAKARSMLEQIETDFDYYVEVSEIKKVMMEDESARSTYNFFVAKIETIRRVVTNSYDHSVTNS